MPLNNEQIINAIKKLREVSPQRKFKQSVDLQVTLKDTDVKKPENKIKESVLLPSGLGKKISIAIFVDKELVEDAKKVFDEVILKDDFSNYTNKKLMKKFISAHRYYVAQANLMGDVAQYFGKFLGPKGKMPDPKAGCVIPIKKELLKPVYEKLQKTVMVRIKEQPLINVLVGNESMKDEELAANIQAVYNVIEQKLPRHSEQMGKVYLKMTMSRSVNL
ncbi:MAG TPA: 50S ribosomal protein L1 [Candidatus Nanoarchaeia archaeon]|nr:50S ribosomal protein L1 [Candidatus Nanoarchaeia archaeon]